MTLRTAQQPCCLVLSYIFFSFQLAIDQPGMSTTFFFGSSIFFSFSPSGQRASTVKAHHAGSNVQPKEVGIVYRFPRVLDSSCLTDYCQTTRASQRVVEILPFFYILFFLIFFLSSSTISEDGPPQSFLFSRARVRKWTVNSRAGAPSQKNITRPRSPKFLLSSRTWYTHRKQSVDYRLMHTETLHHRPTKNWRNKSTNIFWTRFSTNTVELRELIHCAVFPHPTKLRFHKRKRKKKKGFSFVMWRAEFLRELWSRNAFTAVQIMYWCGQPDT